MIGIIIDSTEGNRDVYIDRVNDCISIHWNNYGPALKEEETTTDIFIPRYIEENATRLRQKYLLWFSNWATKVST